MITTKSFCTCKQVHDIWCELDLRKVSYVSRVDLQKLLVGIPYLKVGMKISGIWGILGMDWEYWSIENTQS